MDVEFKLFGSLSAKQFGYILAGGFIGLFFFYLFKSFGVTFLGWIFAFLSAILGVSLALIRINEQPFEIWLGNFMAAMFTSQKRVWKKEKKKPDILNKDKVKPQLKKQQQVTQQKKKVIRQTRETVNTKQQKQKSVPMPHHPFKDMDKDKVEKKEVNMDQSTVTPTQTIDQSLQNQQLAGKQVQGKVEYMPGTAQKYITMTQNQTPNRPVNLNINTPQQSSNSNVNKSNMTNVQKNQPVRQDVKPNSNMPQKQQVQEQSNMQQEERTNVSTAGQAQSPSTGVSSTQHTNKASQYSDVVPNKTETIQQTQTSNSNGNYQQIQKDKTDTNLEEENKALRQKVAEFSEERNKLEGELKKNKDMYSQLQQQNMQIAEQLKQLQSQVQKIESQPKPQASAMPVPTLKKNDVKQKKDDSQAGMLSPKVYQGPSLSKKPNVVSGIVRTKDGKLLPGVVVIVKNAKSRPVRAMKTNSLGQFITTTSLEDGVYVIELSKEDYSFGRFEVKLSGDVLPTYEFVAY